MDGYTIPGAWYAAVQLDHAGFNTAMQLFTDSYLVVFPVVAAVVAYRTWQSNRSPWAVWRHVLSFLGAVGGVVLFSSAVKLGVGAMRPCMIDPSLGIGGCETDYAFPSNHATAVFAVLPWLRFNKNLFAAAAVYAVLVAFSRIYLGQHWPVDVLAGAVLGYTGSYGVHRFYSQRYG